MFKKWFGKKEELPKNEAPEIIGLRLGGAFELDELKLRLIEPQLIIEGAAKTHFIQAVGVVKLDSSSTLLRYYTDDDAILQVLLDGGMTENHISDVKLWYFYSTQSIGSDADWNKILDQEISQATYELEGHTFKRVWGGAGESSPPVAMTEKTYDEENNTTETDQFAMLYEREADADYMEFLLVAGEEKIIDNRADRCLVISTGFNIGSADIQIIG